MTAEELLQLRDLAEEGKIQFKERIIDRYDIGCELVAMSNTHGGRLVIGIDDSTGKINPLSYIELQETTNMLSNMASENVVPSILLEDIENVSVEGGAIVVVTIRRSPEIIALNEQESQQITNQVANQVTRVSKI